ARPDRREHLPPRAGARGAVPHASRGRLRPLPPADSRPVPRELGDAPRGRGGGRPRAQRVPGEHGGPRTRPDPRPAIGGRGEAQPKHRGGPGTRSALATMLEADSVAVVGASARSGSFGERMMLELIEGGYAGRIHPVNPRYEEILGHGCYGTIAELPEP